MSLLLQSRRCMRLPATCKNNAWMLSRINIILRMLKHITLIVTGSIAAVKTFDLALQLQASGAEVSIIVTNAAQQWVTKKAAMLLAKGEVLTTNDIDTSPDRLHVLLNKSDSLCVAPASADFIKQLTYKDSLLAEAIRASGKPLIVAPAMNVMMWQHPATQRNVRQLLDDGVQFLGPVHGKMACGDVGYGRFMPPDDIAAAVNGCVQSSRISGHKYCLNA